ncbi:hypothetical protein E2P81_ATG09824 [Venturia nashicola]|nr:hypothetical protein E2P81_ATG09824 [Venturia nashicola]
MANGWSLIIGFVIIALFSVGSWFLSPKGENQTLSQSIAVHRSPSQSIAVHRSPSQSIAVHRSPSQSIAVHRSLSYIVALPAISQILFLAPYNADGVAPANITYRVWRSSLILSAWSCFLMWAITFLAQWHPLITPINNSLRPEYVH